MTAKRTVLIMNPTSGLSALAAGHGTHEDVTEQILNALRSYGLEPEILYTRADDFGEGLARDAAKAGAELIIAAGGDGTLHSVASGLANTGCALGIIPLGTMNNVARSLQIPENIDTACAIIANGATQQIDMGTMNGLVFLEVAGVGLEAALFPAAEEIKRVGFWSTVRGVWNGFRTLLNFHPTQFVVSFDGRRTRRFRAIQISACNSPYYGARLQFAPHAMMDDGLLDVLIYKNFSKFEYMRHAISIIQGRRVLEPRIRRLRVKSMVIYSEEPVPIHTDGEPQGLTPANIKIQPGVLHVRVPEKIKKGPNVVRSKRKLAQSTAQTTEHKMKQEERGPLHVS